MPMGSIPSIEIVTQFRIEGVFPYKSWSLLDLRNWLTGLVLGAHQCNANAVEMVPALDSTVA